MTNLEETRPSDEHIYQKELTRVVRLRKKKPYYVVLTIAVARNWGVRENDEEENLEIYETNVRKERKKKCMFFVAIGSCCCWKKMREGKERAEWDQKKGRGKNCVSCCCCKVITNKKKLSRINHEEEGKRAQPISWLFLLSFWEVILQWNESIIGSCEDSDKIKLEYYGVFLYVSLHY